MTSPGFCCHGCWRKGNSIPKSGSARRHYYPCDQHKMGPSFELHVESTERIYKALERRRLFGVEGMAYPLSLPIHNTDIELTFVIHGMEPELPTDPSLLADFLPDPRYPDWDAQIKHHELINAKSQRAREAFWGCRDRDVIICHLDMSDLIGAWLEHTGRMFWTQAGKYSHSYCEHILQDPWCHNHRVFQAEKERLSDTLHVRTNSDGSQSNLKHFHLFDKHNMSELRTILDTLNEEDDYQGPVMVDPKHKLPISPKIELSTIKRHPRDREIPFLTEEYQARQETPNQLLTRLFHGDLIDQSNNAMAGGTSGPARIKFCKCTNYRRF